jgi:DNA-directed RNA polymerase subunit H (RpoH/RPB5)
MADERAGGEERTEWGADTKGLHGPTLFPYYQKQRDSKLSSSSFYSGAMDMRSWARQIGVIEQMLLDRGCTELKAVGTGVDPVLLCTCRDERREPMAVFLTDEPKVGVKSVRKLREDAQRAGTKHILFGCPDGLTPFATKELKEDDGSEVVVEVFRKAELAFCLARHTLVPPHQLLSGQERKELLAHLGCKASALPKLKESDPVARYFRFPTGSVVRIDRRIGNLESEPYFRCVVGA